MAAKGKSTKQKTAGTKTTKARAAGRTVRAETWTVPRSAKQLATAIQARLKRSPDYWNQLAAEMAAGTHPRAPTRVAQVMPRTNAPEAATHH